MAFGSKVLGEGLGVTETLQCRVHEASVAQVAKASCSLFCGFYNEKSFKKTQLNRGPLENETANFIIFTAKWP